ncbi:MAG: hypothetical protein J6S14_15700 [Clostridia bacterium]|nr:hypothetical protein [Clostridia bacterium]
MVKHSIWNSEIEMENWQDFLAEEYPDLDPDDPEAYYLAAERNDLYLGDERTNLNVNLHTPILLIAELGLWDGKHRAADIIRSGNIADCLYSKLRGDSECHWYIDEHDDLICAESHHDGTNYYTYRAVKPTPSGDTENRISSLIEKHLAGTLTTRDLSRYTYRLGDAIAAVYGWEISRKGRRKEA